MSLQPSNGTPPLERQSSVGRVLAALAAHGLDHLPVREFAERTATAADAAAALGTSVACIVKSLVFVAADRPILVLASGPNRVDLEKVGRMVGQPVARANANQVRQATGFAIGGVAPVGHTRPLPTYVDRDLLRFDEVWAAAGTPNTVFAISPGDLVRITDGRVVDVAEAPPSS
jgi:prolyl-tRNA editing enzyme YbaK/EbsC (Cys-tRNA(Pro) deacylase)